MEKSDNAQVAEEAVVKVDAGLSDLIPGFLENRRRDVRTIEAALTLGDYQAIKHVAHQMKGAGGGYGFDAISEIGSALEQAAVRKDGAGVGRLTAELAAYLKNVRVSYV